MPSIYRRIISSWTSIAVAVTSILAVVIPGIAMSIGRELPRIFYASYSESQYVLVPSFSHIYFIERQNPHGRERVEANMKMPLDWTISDVLSPAVIELQKAVDYRICGVMVFWAPFEVGKSFALRDMAKILQQKGRIAKYINAKHLANKGYPNFSSALRSSLGMSLTSGEIDDFIALGSPGLPATLILDHFEDLMIFADTKPIITGLARESRERKTFNIVVGVSSFQLADEIISWNGGQKIRMACGEGCGRWDEVSLRKYALSLPVVQRLHQDEIEQVIQLSIKAGSAGKVEEIALSSLNTSRAAISAEAAVAWEDGASALKKWYGKL